MPRFVLEIGTEEIPPRFFPPALAQLKEEGGKVLQRARLAHGALKVYGTPRRLALIAEDLAARQASATREERGPAARFAYDEDGKATKAALGFARRHGVAAETLEVRETEQGPYVFAVITEPELSAREALAPLLPGLITGLSFPKSMRWGAGKLRFGRPIRWLLALVDDEVVEFELNGIRSGRQTRGHPVLAEEMFPVAEAHHYEHELRHKFVIVDHRERQKEIEKQLEAVAKRENARFLGAGVGATHPLEVLMRMPDEFAREMEANLLLQTTFLVEWPTATLGRFDQRFLDLPRDVLLAEMQYVQSYFPAVPAADSSKLLPAFLAVRDGDDGHIDIVRKGWESVLKAKLIDAQYFYEQDSKVHLECRVEALKGVVFQNKLGTMYDKTQRIRLIAADAAGQLPPGSNVDPKAVDRAALLCKADLTTAMVTELPQLQGVVGGIYAQLSGEPRRVHTAIADHYRPQGPLDEAPQGDTGCLLAVSDKIDTLAACFAAGVVATGSADPSGLRRAAAGLVRLLGEAGPRLSLRRLVSVALDALYDQVQLARSKQEVIRDVTAFLRQRLDSYLQTQRGHRSPVRYDLVNAALAVGFDDIYDAVDRADALQYAADTKQDFLPTVIACTRPINISKDFEGGEPDPQLFQEDAERDLWAAYNRVLDKADEVNLVELFQLFGTELRAPIDRYFEDVLVMAEDEKLRRNRLAVCWQLSQLFRRLADFSLVVQA